MILRPRRVFGSRHEETVRAELGGGHLMAFGGWRDGGGRRRLRKGRALHPRSTQNAQQQHHVARK